MMVAERTLQERFEALSHRDRQAILDKHRDWNTDHDWWEWTYEDFAEKVEAAGFTVYANHRKTPRGREVLEYEVYFSGFSCQGDGAGFNGRVQDWDKVLGDKYPLLAKHKEDIDMRLRWTTNDRWGYGHSFDETFEVHHDGDLEEGLRLRAWRDFIKELEAEWGKLVDDVKERVNDLCRDLYKDLEAEHEYLTSDEAVLESLLNNESILEDELKEYEDDGESGDEESV